MSAMLAASYAADLADPATWIGLALTLAMIVLATIGARADHSRTGRHADRRRPQQTTGHAHSQGRGAHAAHRWTGRREDPWTRVRLHLDRLPDRDPTGRWTATDAGADATADATD